MGPKTVSADELRSIVEALRGDLKDWREEMLREVRAVIRAQEKHADNHLALAERVRVVEQSIRKLSEDIAAAKRASSESSAHFDAAQTGLARILATQREEADARFARLERAMLDEGRLKSLAIAIVVVAGILLLAQRIDFGQFMIVTSAVGGGTPLALRQMAKRRNEQEKR